MDIELRAKIQLHSKRLMELGLALNATENPKEIYGLTDRIGKQLEILQELECQFTDEEQGFVGGHRKMETDEEIQKLTDAGYARIHRWCQPIPHCDDPSCCS